MAKLERTCVACRRREIRTLLLRFVSDSRGHLRLDPQQRLSGRGVYTCPTRTCLELATRREGFARSLRRRLATVDASAMVSSASEELNALSRQLRDRALKDGRAKQGFDGCDQAVIVEERLKSKLATLEGQSLALEEGLR